MTFVLAEAGTNHMGHLSRAFEYVDVAAKAGCDGVKFQAFVPNEPLFCPMEGDEKRRERWDASWLPRPEWEKAKNLAHKLGLKFVLSIFQETAFSLLNLCDYTKVASRAAPVFPWRQGKPPFIISNGMGHTPNIPMASLVLDCLMEYPAPLKKCFWSPEGRTGTSWLTDGISDHSGTVWPGIDACFKGAKMVEVHFAIDPDDAGPDRAVCLTPEQLKLICEARDAAARMHED